MRPRSVYPQQQHQLRLQPLLQQRLLMLTVAFLCFHATFQNSSPNELQLSNIGEFLVSKLLYAEKRSFPLWNLDWNCESPKPSRLDKQLSRMTSFWCMETRWAFNPKQPRLTLMMQIIWNAYNLYVYILYTYCWCKTCWSQKINKQNDISIRVG